MERARRELGAADGFAQLVPVGTCGELWLFRGAFVRQSDWWMTEFRELGVFAD